MLVTLDLMSGREVGLRQSERYLTSQSSSTCADMDRKTFEEMWRISEPGHPAAHCFLRIHQTEFFEKEMPEVLHSLSEMPNVSLAISLAARRRLTLLQFRHLPKDKLPEGTVDGIEFDSKPYTLPAA